MRLIHRLVLSFIGVIVVLMLAIALVLDVELHDSLRGREVADLTREAQLVAMEWTGSVEPAVLAARAGVALKRRVTLIRPDGIVLGDSEFDSLGLGQLQNHATRPEVAAALRGRIGASERMSPSEGDSQLYVAVPATRGVARVSVSTAALDADFNRAQRDIWTAGVIAATVALLLAVTLARAVSAPVLELRDAARAIARGDRTDGRHRPAIGAPGEIGELADALHRMSDQLAGRLQKLAQDEALLSAVVESLGEGVLAIGPRRTVVLINTAARRMLNVGQPVPFSIEQLPRDSTLHGIIATAAEGAEGGPGDFESGGRLMTATARPLQHGGLLLILSDVGKTRRLESMRSDFVANVSHELRTPLTVIRGFTETLADRSVPEPDRERFVAAIASNANRMQRIVDELLDLSRIESGGWAPRPTHVDLAAVAADAVSGCTAAGTRGDVVLELDIDPAASHVYADETALRQILGNLVENASRHTRRGSITITGRRSADGTVRITVRDTGSGIPAVHLPRIFERFYRADSARSRDSGGTGLGLAVVKHLVEAHGGSIAAESVQGRGTSMCVTFPPPLPDRLRDTSVT